MRPPDEFPTDPELLAELEAIDATLAGEPVDPRHAELAELALIVAAERPAISADFAAALDGRVEQRFRRVPGVDVPGTRSGSSGARHWFRPVWWQAGGGFAVALAATVAIVIGFGSGGSNGPAQDLGIERGIKLPAAALAPAATTASVPPTASSASSPSAGGAAGVPYGAQSPSRHGAATAASKSAPANGPAQRTPVAAASVPAPTAPTFGPQSAAASGVQPQANGRKQIQSAQLSLMAAPSRIDDVAQEAFNVIGANAGIVNHSTVTAGGPGGYAQLRISVPSQNLAQAMTQLSRLPYAHVLSRTDMSQDVNDQYLVDVRRLADARALRTSLLKQLAAATTQTEVDSLNAQIHDNELAIESDETTLGSLNKRINFSQIDLTINAGAVPVPVRHHSGTTGFTLHKALHDAGRVLVVVAGVALIALAALVPLALVVALVAWIAYWLRRRGRESALDAAS